MNLVHTHVLACRGRKYASRLITLALAASIGVAGLNQDDRPAKAAPIGQLSTVPADPTPESKAATEARKSGKRVVVGERTDEARQIFAEPNGTFTSEMHPTAVRVRRGTDWVGVDTALAATTDGTIIPKVTAIDVAFSGGGNNQLVRYRRDGKELIFGWPTTLPKPTLAGNTATYAEVLRGVDLTVSATPKGFTHAVVVKDRAASANPALAKIRYPMTATGLSAKLGEAGSVSYVDSAGSPLLSSGTAVMWDTAPTTAGARNASAATSSTEPAPGAKQVTMPVQVDAGKLELTPNRVMLDDAATRYPVVLDPGWTNGGLTDWTVIHRDQGEANTSFYGRQGAEAKSGDELWEGSTGLWRSMFRFSMANLRGATILGETKFKIKLNHSASCGDTPVNLELTRPLHSGSTWNNSVTSSNWFGTLTSGSAHANEKNPECYAGDTDMWFGGGNVVSAVQRAANGEWGDYLGLGLKAPNESDPYQWKRFWPGTAVLSINYNWKPNTPTGVTTIPGTPCTSGANRIYTNDPQPQFTAWLSDPNGGADAVSGLLQINQNGTKVYSQQSGNVLGSGGWVSWSKVPAGTLRDGNAYSYQVAAWDGTSWSEHWSPSCEFQVDTTKPGTPVIDRGSFTEEWGPPVGTTGSVTFRPAAGDADVVKYIYGFQADRLTNVALADANGKATVPITLWHSNPTWIHVRAVDRANNETVVAGQLATPIRSKDSPATPSGKYGDANGDGKVDATFLYAENAARHSSWTITSSGGGFHGPVGRVVTDGDANDKFRPVKGDFTGDGRTDTAFFRQMDGDRVVVSIYAHDGSQLVAPSDYAWDPESGKGWYVSRIKPVAGDFNADGKDDIGILYNYDNCTSGIVTLTSDGTRFNGNDVWKSAANAWCWDKSKLFGGNFNGDVAGSNGRDDIGIQYNANKDNCTTEMHTLHSRGTGGFDFVKQWTSGSGAWCADSSTPLGGDLNNDGKTDIAVQYDHGNCTVGVHKLLSRAGTGFDFSNPWTSNANSWCANRSNPVIGDFDNDNQADIGVLYTGDDNQVKFWTFYAKDGLRPVSIAWDSGPKRMNGWGITPL